MHNQAKPPPGRALWDRVEHERLLRGWTKSELANRAGLHRPTIERLRTGSRPLPATVNALADALSINREEAHQLAGLHPEPEEPKFEQIVISVPAVLSKADRQAVAEFAERIALNWAAERGSAQ